MIHCGNGARLCQSPGLPVPEERVVVAAHTMLLILIFVYPYNMAMKMRDLRARLRVRTQAVVGLGMVERGSPPSFSTCGRCWHLA